MLTAVALVVVKSRVVVDNFMLLGTMLELCMIDLKTDLMSLLLTDVLYTGH